MTERISMMEETKNPTSEEEVTEEVSTEEEVETAEAEAEEEMTKEDRKEAKKKAKADKKGDALKEKIAELEDKTMRQLAEFENFRNRTEKEKQAMFETGARSVIEKLLPVVDNFERGLATVPEEEKDTPFVDGMNKIYKQLMTELDNMGVKPIEAVGKEFDPNFHNAVMQVESEEFESGIVAQELQKGYTYRDTVVRHSMVAVVQ
ncbi:MAG: nucleotide exchange factor GrpE [Lachnospiraceae bacterium]|nr:nucleotide exchange factor GrpE [Lachnospiraceae bacterium]